MSILALAVVDEEQLAQLLTTVHSVLVQPEPEEIQE